VSALVAEPAVTVGAPTLYAFTLGLVASMNPCGFPLLPAFLTVFVDGPAPGGWAMRTGRALRAGTAVTAGFVAVFGVLGAAVSGGVHLLSGWVPWLMVPLGVALVALGLLTLVGRGPRLVLPTPSVAGRRGVLAMGCFGVAYAVASLSCALPLFVAGVAGSFTRLGPGAGLMTALAYSLGMGLFLVAASLAVAWAGGSVLRHLRPLGWLVPRLAGLVLVAVGAYLTYYWTLHLVDPLAQPGVVRVVEHVQVGISNWLAGAARPVGIALGVVVVGSCVLLAWRPWWRSNSAITADRGRPEGGQPDRAQAEGGGAT